MILEHVVTKTRQKKVVASINCALSEMTRQLQNMFLNHHKCYQYLHQYHWDICMSKNVDEDNWMPVLQCDILMQIRKDVCRLVDDIEFGKNHAMLVQFTDDKLDKVHILSSRGYRGRHPMISSRCYAWRLGCKTLKDPSS